MKLKPRQIHAIQLLAVGTPLTRVAQTLEISEMTLWRWGKQAEFQSKLNSVANSGMEQIAKTLNAAALTAAETLQEILCDLSQPVPTRMRAALGVLNAMGSVNAALERGLQHRAGDFDLNQRWNSQGSTYDQRGEPCHGTEEHITV
jgi:hypothetical protein